uniref:Putative solute carrier family 5 sodium/glucose cotransporter member 12 n=1 Tax=Ixodes ricinus TaxID=34613 RepID=V5ICC7_IXORI
MVAQVHPAEFVVFGGLMAINLGVGLYFALRHTHRHADTEEVFLGGRSLGAIPLSLSVLATMVTAIGIVGFTTHFYVYGLHVVWGSITALVVVPFIAKVVIPVIYNLKVTSVFQYLRMRFGNKVGITACVFYFLLNQVQGAVGIFAAAVAISTSFRVSLVGSTLAIGAAGTVYTALGGLRGVVWTDSMQGILVLICPITIIVKIIYDSFYDPEIRLRPLSDLNIEPYLFEASLDFTNDENVWASLIAVSCSHFYRMGMDQIVVQRYAAARTLQEAQTTAYVGTILLVISYIFLGSVAISLVYWYRDCDPLPCGTHHQNRTVNSALLGQKTGWISWFFRTLPGWRRKCNVEHSLICHKLTGSIILH